MKYLFAHWDRLKKELDNTYIFLFLDYDGTLTPIVESPDKAIIPSETKDLLKKLLSSSKYKLAIISGRALEDIKQIVGIAGLIYVGNHGSEIEGAKIKFKSLISPRQKAILGQIKDQLNGKILKIKGVLVEDKGLGLSIHYRLADKKNIPLVKKIINQTISPYLMRGEIREVFGKRVIELRVPGGWDKGKVVLWLLARQRFILKSDKILPVYIGDDVTDRDAFKALKNKGMTIFVGTPRDSSAQYYLKNPEEVAGFLRRVLELKEGANLCQK